MINVSLLVFGFACSRELLGKPSGAMAECFGKMLKNKGELGILVLGFNRPDHLGAVLESLARQKALDRTHVWIDGTQGRGEYQGKNEQSIQVAQSFEVRDRRVIKGHLGIEKLMLDALGEMSALYPRVLVLEDDCFPLANCVEQFETALAEVADADDIYSVYGHHFGLEPVGTQKFPRFQGWGWAAHSDRIAAILPELRALFMMSEQAYLNHIHANMNADIEARLDVTPGRNVLKVLQLFFSWDSATSFLCAQKRLSHWRTRDSVVVNTGIHKGTGHFQDDAPGLRAPPFNMIQLEEAWGRYERSHST